MSMDHVSRRHGAAIVLAVLGLIVTASDVAAADELSKPKAPAAHSGPAAPEPTCHAWIAATHRANEKAGENKTHDVTIKALARACRAIPAQIRHAAGEVQKMTDPTERAAVLGASASAALGAGCAIAEPHVNALAVARTCPLPYLPPTFRFRLDEGELAELDAVDYLILNVMLRSLIAANEFDDSAQALMLEFTLSAEINRDDFQQRHDRQRHRSR